MGLPCCPAGCYFGAKPVIKGGKALLSIDTLSQLGLERAKTAVEAVQIMGDLAVLHGFCECATAFLFFCLERCVSTV